MDKTKNYKLFKLLESNRPINPKKVEELVFSIQQKNLLEYRPIMVDGAYSVIDGQHRLKAAEKLGLEIYYQIKKDLAHHDMLLLNANQTKWTSADFMNFHIEEGNANYRKLNDFMKKYKLPLHTALLILGLRNKNYDDLKEFRLGNFKFIEEESVKEKMEFILNVMDYIKTKSMEGFRWHTNGKYVGSLCKVINTGLVDFDVFLQKLQLRIDKIKPCVSKLKAIEMWVNIYNFRNNKPLDLNLVEATWTDRVEK